MLITPAMASEPYWAAAPSRNTSIRSIAAAGIAFKSTPTVPRPNVPLTCTSAGGCRRFVTDEPRAHAVRAGRDAQVILSLLVGEDAARRPDDHDARPDQRRARLGCRHGSRDRTGLLRDQRDEGDDKQERDTQRKHGGQSHRPPPGR